MFPSSNPDNAIPCEHMTEAIKQRMDSVLQSVSHLIASLTKSRDRLTENVESITKKATVLLEKEELIKLQNRNLLDSNNSKQVDDYKLRNENSTTKKKLQS